MNRKTRKHYIDSMFLMILFLIFTFSAVSVLLLAINSYRSVVDCGEKNASARVLCAYIREKVRQNDAALDISLETVDGIQCLKFDQEDGSFLYIYNYEGKMKELFAVEGSDANLEFGEDIADIEKMDIDFSNKRLLKVEISDSLGNDEQLKIAIHSATDEEQEAMDEE